MRCKAVRNAGRYVGLTVATGLSAAAGAQSVQTGMTVSSGVSAETNPYSQAGASGASLAATAEIAPQVALRTETSTLFVGGLAQFRQFFSRYGLEDNYSGNIGLTTRASDRLTLRANGAFAYNQGGFNNFGRPGLSPLIGTADSLTPTDPTTAPLDVSVTNPATTGQPPLLTDVTLIGRRTRTKTFQAGSGFEGQLGDRSSLSGDIGLSALRVRSNGLNEYDSANAELRYSHQVSGLTSIGVIGTANLVNYRKTRFGDTVTKSALLSFDRRFSAGWALSLGAGASFSDITQLAGQPNTQLTALSIRGQFCKRAEYSQLCLGVQRSPQPAASGSVRVSNSFTAAYSQRLNDRARLSLNGAYSRTERGQSTVDLPAASFASASARYDYTISPRATLFTSGNISRVYGFGATRRPNIGAALGVQFGFGGSK